MHGLTLLGESRRCTGCPCQPCVAMSSRSPNQHHHQLPWRQHIIIQPTPPPSSSLTSSAAAPDFGCEQVKKAKVSFPQFCLHPSSFLRYDPLGLPFSSLQQGHLSKSCLNRVLRPKYLSRERAHVRHVRLCERRGHLLQGSEHFVRGRQPKREERRKMGFWSVLHNHLGGRGIRPSGPTVR